MEGLASSSISPDQARTQHTSHLAECGRCRRADGMRRRMCRTGRDLKQRETDASAAVIARAGGAL